MKVKIISKYLKNDVCGGLFDYQEKEVKTKCLSANDSGTIFQQDAKIKLKKDESKKNTQNNALFNIEKLKGKKKCHSILI